MKKYLWLAEEIRWSVDGKKWKLGKMRATQLVLSFQLADILETIYAICNVENENVMKLFTSDKNILRIWKIRLTFQKIKFDVVKKFWKHSLF